MYTVSDRCWKGALGGVYVPHPILLEASHKWRLPGQRQQMLYLIGFSGGATGLGDIDNGCYLVSCISVRPSITSWSSGKEDVETGMPDAHVDGSIPHQERLVTALYTTTRCVWSPIFSLLIFHNLSWREGFNSHARKWHSTIIDRTWNANHVK